MVPGGAVKVWDDGWATFYVEVAPKEAEARRGELLAELRRQAQEAGPDPADGEEVDPAATPRGRGSASELRASLNAGGQPGGGRGRPRGRVRNGAVGRGPADPAHHSG